MATTLQKLAAADKAELKAYCEQSYKANEGYGRKQLRLIGGLLSVARQLCRQYADDHTDGCGCDGCKLYEKYGWAQMDARGMEWLLEITGGLMESSTPYTFEADGETFADDLRGLLALAEETQAARERQRPPRNEDDASDDADAPTAVVLLTDGGAR